MREHPICRKKWSAHFFGSIQLKTLALLFVTIVLACVITFVVMYYSIQDFRLEESIKLIKQRTEFIVTLMDRSDFTPEEFIGLYKEKIGRVELYKDFRELPPMTGVIKESDMREGQAYLTARKDELRGIVKRRGVYFSVSPYIYEWEGEVAKKLVFHTLVTCALIASLCTMISLQRVIRPLKQLDGAIRKVGRGEFNVHVKYRGHDEMGKIVANFNWMTEALGGIEYLRRDFVSSVSHEFKTPVAAVQGSAKLLSSIPWEKMTEEKLKKYTGLILEETARMSNLSSNLLRLSKLESQKCAENIIGFSLDEQIRRSVLQLESVWSAKGLAFDISLDEVDCYGDEELLAQVWTNVLANAVKFTGTGGSVRIQLTASGENAFVEIADTGIGMNQETRMRLFEKFYQGDSSRGGEGSGLGLSIVKRIIDLHSGSIQYESAPGQGTTVLIVLPLDQTNATEEAEQLLEN